MKKQTYSLALIAILVGFGAGCSPKKSEEKIEKEVKVEMTVQGDSAAEATVTITTDSAGREVQTVNIIKGTPESVKTTVSKIKN